MSQKTFFSFSSSNKEAAANAQQRGLNEMPHLVLASFGFALAAAAAAAQHGCADAADCSSASPHALRGLLLSPHASQQQQQQQTPLQQTQQQQRRAAAAAAPELSGPFPSSHTP